MLGEGPCFPFFPHLIGEENDEYVVQYDEGERCARGDAEDDYGRDQSEGERDFVGLVELCSH